MGAPQTISRLFSQPATHARLFEDKVYNHDDWRRHRNAAWRHRVEPVVFARVAAGFVWQLAAVVLVSVAVGIIHTLWPEHEHFLSANRLSVPYSMITFALSLLLVFKTNSSYSRWWEGRIIWGQIVNFGRNYARQALMWFPRDRPELRAAAVRWACAAPRVLLAHIREGVDVRTEVAGVLLPHEIEWLCGWSNGPMGAGTALGQLVVDAGLPPQLQAELQRQVELYTNMAGGCERIFKTPIPPAYARHTSRFLMLYVVTSPLLLWPSAGWFTPLLATIIAFLLLGVENIGVQVEEPFHVLPLSDICRAIECNVQELERRFAEPLAVGSGGGADVPRSVRGSMHGGGGHGGAAATDSTAITATATDSLLASILTANGSKHNGTVAYNEACVRKRGHEAQHHHQHQQQQPSSYGDGGGSGGGAEGEREGARVGHVRAGRAASMGLDGLPV